MWLSTARYSCMQSLNNSIAALPTNYPWSLRFMITEHSLLQRIACVMYAISLSFCLSHCLGMLLDLHRTYDNVTTYLFLFVENLIYLQSWEVFRITETRKWRTCVLRISVLRMTLDIELQQSCICSLRHARVGKKKLKRMKNGKLQRRRNGNRKLCVKITVTMSY